MMRQTWRWFGQHDTITTAHMRQAGVEGIVTALHDIAPGVVWSQNDINARKSLIESMPDGSPSGLTWDVVESLPVSEVIKTKSAGYEAHIAAYRESLRNLAACGVQVVCYNFMPVLDWTRTVLRNPLPHGGTTMLFDLVDFAAFDLYMLKRPAAVDDYPEECRTLAHARFEAMSEAERLGLINNIVAGLPGSNESWTLDDIRAHLQTYADIGADALRANLIDFLAEVAPLAQELGLRMCCHPDDPPFPLLGLPRIMSNLADYTAVVRAVDMPSNGVTFCTGSLGVNPDFDGPAFVEALGDRIHFAHLRNTTRLDPAFGERSSFYEAAHLGGDTDMVATVRALLAEQNKRKAAGRADWQIPMRPDHGQDLLDDVGRGGMPGYPMIGRMRGLAELRGVMAALSAA